MPAPGDIVLFCMAELQVQHVNRVRVKWVGTPDKPKDWPAGAMAHMGSQVEAGELLPFLVVRAREEELDGKVQLPGSDVMWLEHVRRGDGPGQWRPR